MNDENLLKIKNFKNIILENVDLNINEKLLYTLINIIDQEGKIFDNYISQTNS